MRYYIGKPLESDDFVSASEWTLVTMPEVRRWQIMTFPVALINMSLTLVLWLLLTPAASELNISFPLPIVGFVLCLLKMLIVHEFLHALVHPKAGFSKHSIIGFYPSRMLLYSIYNGELSRERFLITLLMPLVMISFVPIIISAFFQFFFFWLAYITILNAFVAAGDVMEIFTILKQVPQHSSIRRNGWSYYWKRP